MSTDRLLDVFIGVAPQPGMIEATQEAIKTAVTNIKQMFGEIPSQANAAANNATRALANAGGGAASARGSRNQTGLVPEFEAAKRLAQDLQQELQVVARVIRSTGAEDLTNSLQQMTDFLRRIQTNISRQRADQDVLGVRTSLDLLEDFRQQLAQLQTQSKITLDVRGQFDTAAAEARQAINDERIRNRLAESLVRGTPSGDIRKQLLEARAILQALEQEVKDLSVAFDGTEDSVTRLRASTAAFRDATQGLAEIQTQAKAAGPSFNSLTNNAYQLGQAIEDFSVGYTLNGFAGGVRGAANNVAFLLNNLVQADFVQGKINEKWKNALPILSGIGSAVLVTIVPALAEWLESLNDIEQEFKNIENSVNAITADRGIEDSINRSTEAVREFARNAGSVSEISQKILSIRSDVVTLQEEIVGSVRALAGQEVFQDFTKGIDEFQKKLDAVKTSLSGQRALAGNEVPELLRGFIPQQSALDDLTVNRIPEVQGLQDAIGRVSKALKDVREQGATGVISTDALREATNSLRDLGEFAAQAKDPSTKLAESLELADGVAESLEKNVGTLAGAIDDLTAKSREAERAQQDMADAIIFSQNAVRRLVEDSRLELEVLQGRVPETATFIRQLQRASEASKRLQDSIAELARKELLPQGLADRAIANQQEATSLENRIALTERLNSIKEKLTASEERISSLNERQLNDQKSQLTTLEQFTQSLQSNALSVFSREEAERKKLDESLKNEVLERQKLIDSINRLNQAYDAAGNPERLARIDMRADRFSVEPIGAFKGQDYAKAWMEPILRQMVIEQNKTTKAVEIKDTTPRAR